MIRIDVTVDTDVLEAISEAAERAPQRVSRAYSKAISRTQKRMLDDLRAYPGPVKRPFKWQSDRQRRAYFATNGFGHGIPYVRTNALRDSWSVRVRSKLDSSIYTVENDTDYADFVMGEHQQIGHANTGWNDAKTIIDLYREELVDTLIDVWGTVALGE